MKIKSGYKTTSFFGVDPPGPWPDPPISDLEIKLDKGSGDFHLIPEHSEFLKIKTDEKLGVILIQPQEGITNNKLPEFIRIMEWASSCPLNKLFIDFSRVEYISSSCLRVIIETHRDLHGSLVIISPNESINEFFQLIRLDRVIDIYKNRFDFVMAELNDKKEEAEKWSEFLLSIESTKNQLFSQPKK